METTYFKIIGQKSGEEKMILVAVVNKDFLGEVPEIFEVEAIKEAPTIYTGTYPSIRVNTSTIKDRVESLRGNGINNILLKEKWYCESVEQEDIFGISLKSRKL